MLRGGASRPGRRGGASRLCGSSAEAGCVGGGAGCAPGFSEDEVWMWMVGRLVGGGLAEFLDDLLDGVGLGGRQSYALFDRGFELGVPRGPSRGDRGGGQRESGEFLEGDGLVGGDLRRVGLHEDREFGKRVRLWLELRLGLGTGSLLQIREHLEVRTIG